MITNLITTIGRRKTAVATIRLMPAEKNTLLIGNLSPKDYFKTDVRVRVALSAFSVAETVSHYTAIAHVKGGGISAQADAIRLAIARALIKAEPNQRSIFKAASMLTRDSRSKERKKPGLKKARKAPQWSKR